MKNAAEFKLSYLALKSGNETLYFNEEILKESVLSLVYTEDVDESKTNKEIVFTDKLYAFRDNRTRKWIAYDKEVYNNYYYTDLFNAKMFNNEDSAKAFRNKCNAVSNLRLPSKHWNLYELEVDGNIVKDED